MLLPFTDRLIETGRFDCESALLADRHYSRGKIGSPQFAPPGELIVLRDASGLVVFTWVRQQFRLDEQFGYYCSMFRNESPRLSSDIILEAETFAVARWGAGRAFTFIDPRRVASANPGYCFKRAGWKFVGLNPKGQHILEKYLP